MTGDQHRAQDVLATKLIKLVNRKLSSGLESGLRYYFNCTGIVWAEEEHWAPRPHQKRQWSACCLTMPINFNYLCHWGVAAKAGSVHLIFSMDRKGGAWPLPQQHYPVPPLQSSVDWPHKQSHKNYVHTSPKCTYGCSATPPTQELTSFPIWAEQHHLLTATPTSHLRCLSSGPTVCTNTLV